MFTFKRKVGHAVGEWYDEFLRSKCGNGITTDYKRERDYSFVVLYPVVVMLIFSTEEIQVDLDATTESKTELDVVEKQYISYQELRLPRWGDSYNNTNQRNTCPLDNFSPS